MSEMTREEQAKVMAAAIIEAALWVGYFIPGEGEEPIPLYEEYLEDDLAPRTVEEITERAANFIETYSESVNKCVKFWVGLGHSESYSWRLVGHDYLLTCKGSGAGFWDRGMGDLGEELTKAAHAEGSLDLYPGDDGLLYI